MATHVQMAMTILANIRGGDLSLPDNATLRAIGQDFVVQNAAVWSNTLSIEGLVLNPNNSPSKTLPRRAAAIRDQYFVHGTHQVRHSRGRRCWVEP